MTKAEFLSQLEEELKSWTAEHSRSAELWWFSLYCFALNRYLEYKFGRERDNQS